MAKTVVGLYEEMSTAQQVIRELQNNGFRREDISLVANDKSGEMGRYMETHKGDNAADGAATGAGVGAVLGGMTGLLVGLGALAIPGVGPLLAAGPLAAALAGAGIGAAAGGLVGALVDAGVPEDDANLYNEGVRHGGTLVMVNAPDNTASSAADIMGRFHPIDVDQRSSEWSTDKKASSTTTATDSSRLTGDRGDVRRSQKTGKSNETLNTEGEKTLPIVEEEMRVGKRQVQSGGVRVHTRMTEQPVQEDVTLRKERVNVERRPADRPASEQDLNAFREGSFEVTETSEEAVVDKQARVTGEVVIRKDVDQHTETISDTVRRTEVDTDDIGDRSRTTGATRSTGTTGAARPTGASGSTNYDTFEGDDALFRRHYDTSYASRGNEYSYYQPAYRYGSTLRGNQSYANREWTAVERDAQRDWETNHPESTWEEIKDAVREGFNSMRNRGTSNRR